MKKNEIPGLSFAERIVCDVCLEKRGCVYLHLGRDVWRDTVGTLILKVDALINNPYERKLVIFALWTIVSYANDLPEATRLWTDVAEALWGDIGNDIEWSLVEAVSSRALRHARKRRRTD